MDTSKLHRNPYIIGRPITEPELFFGREELFQFISDTLNQEEKVILLYGQRRIGKSSVLSQIPKKVGTDRFVFVPFDLQDKSQLPLGEVLYSLAREIIEYLELDEDRVKSPSIEELAINPTFFSSNFLHQVYHLLGDKKLVLLLDEFDVLSNYNNPDSAYNDFFPYLKSLVKEQDKLFFIPVLGRQLDDMLKLLELFKGAPNYKIGLLDETSAKQLIAKPVKGVLEYEEDAIQAILELSAGHPNFTQLLCFALFGRARQQDNWKVTRADVEKIIDKAIENGEPALLWFREGLAIPERVIFSTVAEMQRQETFGSKPSGKEPLKFLEEYGVVQTEPLRKAGDILVKWGFLRQVEAPGLLAVEVPTYEVTIELVRLFFLKNRYYLREEIYKLENIDEEVNSQYKKATETYEQDNIAEAIVLYEQVLKANPNHFSALLKLAEAYLDCQEFNKAIECYERAYKVNPVNHLEGLVRARLSYGDALMQKKQFYLAQNQFNEVLILEPNNSFAEQRDQKAVEAIRKALKSPFVIGNIVPPDQFVGREDEFLTVFDLIFTSSNIVFEGGVGIGKSSFLEYLAKPETWQKKGLNKDDELLLVYINCKNIDPFSRSAFWIEVLSRLKEVLGLLKEKLETKSHNSTSTQSKIKKIDSLLSEIEPVLKDAKMEKEHLKSIVRQVNRHNKWLVLLLDDYDTVLQPKDNYSEAEMLKFLREFRNLVQHEVDRCISTFMTSSKPLIELGSESTVNELPYTCQPLKAFKDAEVADLWNFVDDEQWKKREDLRKTVQQITGGYPALLQMACFHLYKVWRQQPNSADETLATELSSQFEVNAGVLLRRIWKSLNDIERMLLRIIALYQVGGKIEKRHYDLSGIEDFLKEQTSKLNSLEKRGIIKITTRQNKTAYSFTASAMQKWVIDEILNNNEAEVTQRERVFLLMNKGHVNQIKKSMQWLGENADFVKSIAGGIQELVKLLLV